eukprot:m.58575 g.58575  ORF g.58575 m.58575 type:complete len:257 (+) comp6913_c0_seq2:3-773(+)
MAHSVAEPAVAPRGVRVVCAGMGRTGTTSLAAALEQLGFGPVYHMNEVHAHGEAHSKFWTSAFLAADPARDVDFRGFLAGYGAVCDGPANVFYKEIAAAFPGAKIIMNTRDAEKWYASARRTIYAADTDWSTAVNAWFSSTVAAFKEMVDLTWVAPPFNSRFEDREYAVGQFRAYQQEVLTAFPDALVYEVKQGWGPLCAHLGVPVPAAPFPAVNDAEDFHRTFITPARWQAAGRLALVAAIATGAGLAAWAAWKR